MKKPAGCNSRKMIPYGSRILQSAYWEEDGMNLPDKRRPRREAKEEIKKELEDLKLDS